MTLDDQKSKTVDFKIVWSSSPSSSKYKSYFSSPELIEFPTEVPGQNAYAYFYPPTNPIYQATQEEKPPLLLKSHGMFIVYFLQNRSPEILVIFRSSSAHHMASVLLNSVNGRS